jgi:hypothetical protein
VIRRQRALQDRPGTQALLRLAGAQAVAVRELRLLFGVLLILFLTSEVWRYAGRLDGLRLTFVISSTLGMAGIVVGVGLRRTLSATFTRSTSSRAALRVITEVTTFGVLLCLLLSVLGFVSMDYGLVAEWSGDGAPRVLLDIGVFNQRLVITPPLLQVSACLGTLGSLVFAIEVVLDAEARTDLLSDLLDEV